MIELEKIEIMGSTYILREETITRQLYTTEYGYSEDDKLNSITKDKIKTAGNVSWRGYRYDAIFENDSNLIVFDSWSLDKADSISSTQVVECIIEAIKEKPELFKGSNNIIEISDYIDGKRNVIITFYENVFHPEVNEFKTVRDWIYEIRDTFANYKGIEFELNMK